MKLWTGMLSGEIDKRAEEFNSSIAIDQRMVYKDIEGSIAHVTMLGETHILEKDEVEKILEGLDKIYKNLEEGRLEIDPTSEDIHTFVEASLIEEIGELGKKMHTARSRNDQVATDLRLYSRDECEDIEKLLVSYIGVLAKKAEANLDTIMPGYTHLQAAQAVTFAHHLMAYAMMGIRDLDRLRDYKKRLNQSPLGACALAGTTYPIDRDYTANLLCFEGLCENSMDAVSDRDFVIELQSVLATIAIHLSRLAEELIIWSSQLFAFVSIADGFVTGSSIMPQKKNPDMAELIRSKSARVIGNMNQSYIMLKGLPLAYSKDMQEDKEMVFDSVDTIKISLEVMAGQIETLRVNKENMLRASQKGYINATDVADYLVNKGMAFRDAHHIAASLVKYAGEHDLSLDDLDMEVYKKESDLFETDIYEAIDLANIVNKRTSKGGPAKSEVKRQIDLVKNMIS